MMSLAATRKRKDAHNMQVSSHDKGKVRIVEKAGDVSTETPIKFPRLRPSLPNTAALRGIRRGSVKIFSVFRSGKGACYENGASLLG